MAEAAQANKGAPFGLYGVALNRLTELGRFSNPTSKIIRFPIVFTALCRNFSITKKQAWEIVFILRDFGFVEVVPYQGIKVKR